MTLLDLFFPITTIALSVALWSCWRNGKPAREAKRKAAEEEAARAECLANRMARDQFAADVISVLEDIVAGRIEPGKDEDYMGRVRYRNPSVKLLQDLKGDREVIDRILGRADRTHARLNEISTQLHDVHSVLRVYHPRQWKAEELPTIRKG